MKPVSHHVPVAAAHLYLPLMALFALSLFVTRAPGGGVGLLAGILFALAFGLHALVFGARAARLAFPPFGARLGLAIGLLVGLTGAAAPSLAIAVQLAELGLFLTTASGAALTLTVLMGRAPTLNDEDW
jgi:multisubunit Na+/H+ antiporter MnhB subunit